MWYAESTSGKVHKVVAGFYKCNRAVGKISKSKEIDVNLSEYRESDKCKTCFQTEGL